MVEIRPAPSPAEREAILIALDQMLAQTPHKDVRLSAWAEAGRRESLRGRGDAARSGFGRDWDRAADW
jgi:hypothetical protein